MLSKRRWGTNTDRYQERHSATQTGREVRERERERERERAMEVVGGKTWTRKRTLRDQKFRCRPPSAVDLCAVPTRWPEPAFRWESSAPAIDTYPDTGAQ